MRHATRRISGTRPEAGRTGDLFAPPPPPTVAPPAVALPRSAAVLPERGTAPRRLWLALRFAELPLVAAANAASGPTVIVEGEGAHCRLAACNGAAAALGLRAGLLLNAAHALAPTLTVAARDVRLEARHLETLARWAMSLTPFVSLEPPDRLLLEVQGSLRLFGGLEALIERAEADLAAHGRSATLAVAPTPRAALWLVHGAPGARLVSAAELAGGLSRLPVTATGWPERTLLQCARLGVATLGELRRLPRDGLARRFEPWLVDALDEAFGLRPAPRRRHVLRERFQERLELPCEIERVDGLAPYCTRLLERLADFLQHRDAGVTSLVFTCLHRDGKPTSVRLGRALPAAGADDWQRLLRERLGRLVLPAPVRALVLRSGAFAPRTGGGAQLPGVGGGDAPEAAFALLDRLRARLGEAAVGGVGLVAEHRPEAAWRRVRPMPVAGRPASADAAVPLPDAPRPLWLLAAAQRLPMRDGHPWRDGRLALESGPERIESGWWDGAGIARDYYVARSPAGVRLWVFRERHGPPGHWYLHGVFG